MKSLESLDLASVDIILSKQRTPLLFAYGINMFSYDVAPMTGINIPKD